MLLEMEAATDSCVEKPEDSSLGSGIVRIDPAGDVLLEVGIVPKATLLVSSKILSVASGVFKALFQPRFLEGARLSESKPDEPQILRLEDDDPNAMETLCYLLHHQHPEASESPEVDMDRFIEFAIICDKYDCTEATRLLTDAWFRKVVSKAESGDLHKLLLISYFLDEPKTFNRISQRMLLECEQSFLELPAEGSVFELLPIKLYITMENERNKLRKAIEYGLQQPIVPLVRKEHVQRADMTADRVSCSITHTWHQFGTHDSFVISAYLRELGRLGVWPLHTASMRVGDVLEKLMAFEEKEIASGFGFGVFAPDAHCMACVLNPRVKMATLLKEVRSQARGLCLDCVRKGQLKEGECRVKHD